MKKYEVEYSAGEARNGNESVDYMLVEVNGIELYAEATPDPEGEEMRKITVAAWQNVNAGQEVPDGYGKYKKAPSEPGVYTLYELADEDNFHCGWKWEKTE